MKIQNKILASFLEKKNNLITKGRDLSKQIAPIEAEIEELEKEEREITEKVECPEIVDEAKALAEKIDKDVEQLEALYQKLQEEKIAAIPKDLKDKHSSLIEQRKKLTEDRLKVGEEIEALKTKYLPILHKRVKKHLPSKYHDIETAVLDENGDVEITFFSHLDAFKKQFVANSKQG